MNKQQVSEIQLFIIWEKGRYAEQEIINDISLNFEIIQTFSITWTPYLVSTNYSRFYDTKLPSNSQKEVYAGRGEFKLIVVRDSNPVYDYRDTSKGKAIVNTRMFDAKAKYRELTGGGHKIHGTNDMLELKHDLVLLTGLSLDDFLNKYDNKEIQNDIKLTQDLVGTLGWKSFDELFYVLNECNDYLVLRNSENISLQYFEENNGDVDLLVKDRNRCLYLLGDLSVVSSEYKEDSKVSIDNKIVLFELYETGQNVFHKSFEKHLFDKKIKKQNMFCLPFELEFYTLLYHALLFHKNLSEKHKSRIKNIIHNHDKIKDVEVTSRQLSLLLRNYFSKIDCKFIAPNDGSIFFNTELLQNDHNLLRNKKREGKIKRYFNKLIQVSSFKKYLKITFLSFLNNEIDLVFAFRFRFFRKEVRFCLGNRRKYKY